MMEYFDSPAVRAAIAQIEENRLGLAVLQGDEVVYTAMTSGICSALELHDRHPELLRGAVVVDRIIGQAAAMIFADGGAAAIYGSVMNQTAQQALLAQGIAVRAGTTVNAIINRKGDGICPMEQAILGITRPEEGLPLLRATVKRLMEENQP